MSAPKCALCGKFKKESEVVLMQAEGDEQWVECRDCMSPSDEELYFKPYQEKGNENK